MVDWSSVFIVFSIYIAGVIIPGPNFVAVTHEAISSSRKHALALVAGIVVVNLFWAASAILGLGAVFKLFPWLALTAKILGSAYLVWFGTKLIKNAGKATSASQLKLNASIQASFRNGLIVNIANPKSIAFYAAVFSAAAPTDVNFSTLMAMLCVVLVIASVWYGAVAVLFSSHAVSNAFRAYKAWFDRFCGTTIVMLGIKQAFGGSSN
jgi:threonine/homoserine/homoserine lactone efflux protein